LRLAPSILLLQNFKRNEYESYSSFLALGALNGNPHFLHREALLLLENHDGVSHVDIGFSNEGVVARHVVIQHLELEPRELARHVDLEAHSVVEHGITLCDVVLDISIESLVFYILITGHKDGSNFAVKRRLTVWRP
jgi:hypothetical protein